MRQFFTTEQWFPLPTPLVFAFFANPSNLPPLMPGWQHARIDEITLVPPPPLPAGATRYPGVAAGDGTRLLITARAAPGVPLRTPWLALIQDFHWNDHFCDLQVKGPFRYWHHCHLARPQRKDGQDGTAVRDEVEYELPMAPLSNLAAPLGGLAMKAMFRYRQTRAAELLPRFAAEVSSVNAW